MPIRVLPASRGPRAQRGVALVFALVMLLVLGMLGAVAMQTALLEERMAGASADREIAFQAAEAALRDGQAYAFGTLSQGSGFSAACTGGLCLPSSTAAGVWDTVDWQGPQPIVYGSRTGAAPIAGVRQPPRYLVELFPPVPPGPGASASIGSKPAQAGGTAFRITALAWGRKPGTQVMLQSVFVRT